MMKIKYRKSNLRDGIYLLEVPPQKRILNILQNEGTIYSYGLPKYVRLSLPYLYFIVKYDIRKKDKNKYIYRGLGGQGLSVYASLERIKSLKDKSYLLPIDWFRGGVCCTDHKFDNKSFKTKRELVDFVINSWYNYSHLIEYDPVESTNSNTFAGDRWAALNNHEELKLYSYHDFKKLLSQRISGIDLDDDNFEVINRKW